MADIPYQVQRLSTISKILWVCLIRVCFRLNSGEKLAQWHTVDNVDDDQVEYIINDITQTWWEAARSGCDGYGGNLFTRKYGHWPHEVASNQRYGIYWIGAVEFSEWKWTDGSSLYQYEGYKLLDQYRYNFTIEGNSAPTCHEKCGDVWRRFHWFGLQDKKCYCLSDSVEAHDKNYHTEVRCPGNFNDKCGDGSGMSVYSILDNLMQMPYDSYECGYAKITEFPYPSNLSINLFPKCDADDITKCALCSNTGHTLDHCGRYDTGCVVRNTSSSWDTWNKTCSLIKITPDIKTSIISLVTANIVNEFLCSSGYWIGLRKYPERRWIDGRNVNIPNVIFSERGSPQCLAVYTYNGSVTPVWTSCSYKHKSICEILKPKRSTKVPSTVAITPAPSSSRKTPPSSSQSVTRTSTRPPQTSRTPGDMVSHSFIDPDKQHSGQGVQDKTGVYVGSCVAVVVLLAVIVIGILSYRQKRFCFKRKRDSDGQNPEAQFNASSDRVTIAAAQSSGYENTPISVANTKTHTVPVATVRPIYQNVSFEDKGLKKKTDYGNVSGKISQFDPSSSSGNKLTQHGMTGDEDMAAAYESHYEVPVSVTQEQDVDVGNPTYDVVGDGTDANISGTKGSSDGDSTLYFLESQAHLDDRVQTVAAEGSFNGEKNNNHRKPSDGNNVDAPGQSMAKKTTAYDHVRISPQDNLYDTIGQAKIGPGYQTDSDYNHISAERMLQSVDAENYDTKLQRQVRPVQPTSNGSSHEFRVEDEAAGIEGEEDMNTIYHCIDDCYIEEGSTGSGNPRRDEADDMYNLQGEPVNEASYYNITFTPDTESDKRPPMKGRGDNVYSLAKVISDT